jgi:glycosyl transferase family 25
MFEFVEKIVYINLEHRTDRKVQIEEVLKDVSEKVIRFNAIKESHGGIGCTKSHIAVLEMAIKEGWKNYLVVEDDAIWNRFEVGYPILEKLSQNSYDVIVLGAVVQSMDRNSYKLYSGHTTTSYMVNSKYYNTLLKNFKEGLDGFLTTGHYHNYAIDQYWKRIQPSHDWYCVAPSLLIQREGFSDIENRVLNNGLYFI